MRSELWEILSIGGVSAKNFCKIDMRGRLCTFSALVAGAR